MMSSRAIRIDAANRLITNDYIDDIQRLMDMHLVMSAPPEVAQVIRDMFADAELDARKERHMRRAG